MESVRLGNQKSNPANNPAVWDTLTWDATSFIRGVSAQPQGFWDKVHQAAAARRPSPISDDVKVFDNSVAYDGNCAVVLTEHADGQQGLVEFGKNGRGIVNADPLVRSILADGTTASFYEVNSMNLHQAYSTAAPEKLPRALGATPRLGVGTRMSKAMWPGIWQALNECSFSANTIQNSLRELNLLQDVRNHNGDQRLYYPGIGFVPEGHTGSTFEGLWLSGVSGALKEGVKLAYGADADHIMVKRGVDGLERAKEVLMAARYYSFYTIDVSDILDYSALPGGGKTERPDEVFERCIRDDKLRKEVLLYYRRSIKIGARTIRIGEPELAKMIAKYWSAMEAMENLVPFIAAMRNREPYDLELSVDEHPPEIHPFDCLTTEEEAAFLLAESKRRELPLTHLAPNLGVEKHVDYRYHDGLEGLEARTRRLHNLAQELGVVIDCHSGDDLSQGVRQALKRATGGRIHFKVSPYPQTLFADVLYEFDRDMFKLWWDDTYAFAQENAHGGSSLAAELLRDYESEPGAAPHPRFNVFRLFCYATVGKRNSEGDYVYRDKFYSLSPGFYAEYTRRLKDYLCTLAQDLLA